ncbi:MAG TPA: DUF2589 domain-containing protein [Kiloniellaceae bacterium]|nr:DUF2589 domain-containing protein [Kiloniellaceae bacterium]HIP80585.1 DUF2589 domain-containing protein [Kiloniellaceae bacterium]
MAVAGELQALPFGSLIGGPLDAAIEAQAKAAVSSVNFIRSIGFDDKGAVQNITFTAKKGSTETEITVPLLTIVPIPFIRIDEMTIDFKANITSSKESADKTVESTSKSAKVNASARYLFFKASLEASISSKKDSESTKNSKYSVETTIDVHVHAVQDELPAGLAKMLNILADTIQAPPPVTDQTGGGGSGGGGGGGGGGSRGN